MSMLARVTRGELPCETPVLRRLILLGVLTVTLVGTHTPVPANAAVSDRVLILAGTVTGGTASIEATEAAAHGMAVDIVDGSTWSSMTAAQFANYRAIILGDPTCYGPGTSPDINAAAANATTWGPMINGNIVIAGTDPVFHASQGGATLTQRVVDFAIAQSGKTGAYISLSCYYHGTAPNTPVPLLDGIGPGGFTVTGVGCYNNAHIVAESPALAGLTDADLSNWSCSVHEAFQTWPGALVPLAIAKDFDSSYTASDGTQGPPYILAGGDIRSFPLSVSPLNDSGPAGTSHTVTAQLLDGTTRAPVSGAKIGFIVTSGPNAGAHGSCVPATCLTDTNGQVAFTYASNGTLGSDSIQAFYDSNGNGIADVGEPQTTAGMTWTKPLIPFATSRTWAGYVSRHPSNAPVATRVTLPSVTCNTVGELSLWAGYDGYEADSNTVEQDGVAATCAKVGALPRFHLWYELYKARSLNPFPNIHEIAVPTKVALAAGDSVDLFVDKITPDRFHGIPLGQDQIFFTISAYDPHGRALMPPWSKTVTEPLAFSPKYDSAECIAERPLTSTGPVALPNFGNATFSNCSVIDDASSLSNLVRLEMTSNGHALVSTGDISRSSSGENQFSVAWMASS
jgi:hypothetical protein